MAEYYLISQLPSLDSINENTPLPITSERFMELCQRFLNKKTFSELEKLTLLPPRNSEKSTSSLIKSWNDAERNLRLILAKTRAEKLNKQFDTQNQAFSPTLIQAARTAVEFDNPMEAEIFLNKYRLELLETLRPTDSFSVEYIFYYGMKLKLIERIKKFDTISGENAYRNIYSSIMNNERSEVIQ